MRVQYCGDECCTPQQSLTIVVPGRIHALTTTAMSQRSDKRQVLHRCPRFLLDTNNNPCCRAQPAVITFLLKYLFYIFTILPPLPTNIKKICIEQIKMKFNIGLLQNCDQSATVSCSKWSSARNLESQRMAAYLEHERRQ